VIEGMRDVEIADQQMMLFAEKAMFWTRTKTLFIADTHFGKAATFRKAGFAVPQGTTKKTLQRLTHLIQQTSADRLIILGDFVHSSKTANVDFADDLKYWRQEHPQLEMILVRGNHDKGHSKLFSELDLTVVSEPMEEFPFVYCHHRESGLTRGLFVLAGHVHPAIRLKQLNYGENIPCFAIGDSHALLPAFGEFVGTFAIDRNEYVRVLAVADTFVLDIPLQRNRV
jgi:uncharacterized protein